MYFSTYAYAYIYICIYIYINTYIHTYIHDTGVSICTWAMFSTVAVARLPKQWSTSHENAWEWLWMTVARNLNESTMKVGRLDADELVSWSIPK